MPSALLPRTPARSKICLHGSFWSWNHQISAQLFWELSKLTNLFEDRRSTPEDREVGFCSLAQLFTSFSGCRLANSFGAYFGDTLGLPLSCRSNPVDFLVAAFSAGETQIWPGDLRVVAVFLVLFVFSPWLYEVKTFHTFCNLFDRFSHCQDRALERNRPLQRKKMLRRH